mmetsp:Transcript_12465/g.17709  ORF Transcript_12465/g.17709 Transcript_12465/m.17709 type:complete len:280 (+) Transcript_12465:84-923(+)
MDQEKHLQLPAATAILLYDEEGKEEDNQQDNAAAVIVRKSKQSSTRESSSSFSTTIPHNHQKQTNDKVSHHNINDEEKQNIHVIDPRVQHVYDLLGISNDLEAQEQLGPIMGVEDLLLVASLPSLESATLTTTTTTPTNAVTTTHTAKSQLVLGRFSAIRTYFQNKHLHEFDEHTTMMDILRTNQQDVERDNIRVARQFLAVISFVLLLNSIQYFLYFVCIIGLLIIAPKIPISSPTSASYNNNNEYMPTSSTDDDITTSTTTTSPYTTSQYTTRNRKN